MSSPFSIFRRHQRVLMVAVTGMAMLSFVLLGSLQTDYGNVPPTLVVLFLAAVAGVIGWLAGLNSGKGSEWGVSGVILGSAIGLAYAIYTRESSAVYIDNGNLSAEDVYVLQRQRNLANRFVTLAIMQTAPQDPFQRAMAEYRAQRIRFGFQSADATVRDVVLGEVLRREGEKMGLSLSNKAVTDYINEITGNRMTAEKFTEIRRSLNASEQDLLDAIRTELEAQQALGLIYGPNIVPPQQLWEFFKQMNFQESAEIARVPVASFINEESTPSESQLQELFTRYQNNFPNMTTDGQLAEGEPGFLQPRRIQLGYLEAVFDDIEQVVGEVTDEEIQQLYADRYLRAVPAKETDGPELPLLPPSPDGDNPPANTSPPADSPATPQETQPSSSDGSTDQTPNSPAPSKDSTTPNSGEESAPPELPSQSRIRLDGELTPVAFLQEEEPATSTEPAEGAPAPEVPPAAEAPADSSPAAGDDAAPKADASAAPATQASPENSGSEPASTETDATPGDAADMPPPPKTEVPPLDDTLKMQLRDEILKRKTVDEIDKRIGAAFDFLGEMSYQVQRDETDPEYLTLADATQKIKEYAQKHNLVYVVTPLLSQSEMMDSEDFPIGAAMTTIGNQQPVAQSIFQTPERDLYRVGRARSLVTQSSFAYWKLQDKPAFRPENLDEVRDDVVRVWRQLQAAPLARERADALAAIVRDSGKPMAEALADATVTGKEGGLLVEVRETGQVTWMQRPLPPSLGLDSPQVVRPSTIPGVDDAGERFYETMFESLKVGETGVVPNRDGTVYYVIRVRDRVPSNEEELDRMRERFLRDGLQPSYNSLAQQTLSHYQVGFFDALLARYNVQFTTASMEQQQES